MHKKRVILSIVFILALTVSLCWAVPPFKMLLRDMKDHADIVSGQSKEIQHLVNLISKAGVEIEELSKVINLKRQKDKIQRLEEKVDKFQQWVVELDNKTENLKEMAGKLQNDSKMLLVASCNGQIEDKCGPGRIWIPGHRLNNGKWVPGHCARK